MKFSGCETVRLNCLSSPVCRTERRFDRDDYRPMHERLSITIPESNFPCSFKTAPQTTFSTESAILVVPIAVPLMQMSRRKPTTTTNRMSMSSSHPTEVQRHSRSRFLRREQVRLLPLVCISAELFQVLTWQTVLAVDDGVAGRTRFCKASAPLPPNRAGPPSLLDVS